jgi:hypothetical protein
MSKHNKTCRVCINREVRKRDMESMYHGVYITNSSYCTKLKREINRTAPKCKHHKEKLAHVEQPTN